MFFEKVSCDRTVANSDINIEGIIYIFFIIDIECVIRSAIKLSFRLPRHSSFVKQNRLKKTKTVRY